MKTLLFSLLLISGSVLAEEQITNPSILIYKGLKLEAKKTEEDSQIVVMSKEIGPLRCDEYIYKNGESNNYGCKLTYDTEISVSDQNSKVYESINANPQDWMADHIDKTYVNESRKSLEGLSCSRITLNESGTHVELSKSKFTCTLEL